MDQDAQRGREDGESGRFAHEVSSQGVTEEVAAGYERAAASQKGPSSVIESWAAFNFALIFFVLVAFTLLVCVVIFEDEDADGTFPGPDALGHGIHHAGRDEL